MRSSRRCATSSAEARSTPTAGCVWRGATSTASRANSSTAGRRPNVLVLTSSYPRPESPVAGIFVREHALAAAAHCNVRVVHLDRAETMRVRTERLPDEALTAWRTTFPRTKILALPGLLAAARAGFRAATADGFRPDVLHAHFFLAGFPAVLLGRAHRIPVLVTEHWTIFLPEDPGRLSRTLSALARFTFARARVVLPVSTALERALVQLGVRTPMRVIPNAVDLRLFQAPSEAQRRSGELRLLLVGLLTEQKGVDVLLRALDILRRRGLAVHLDVVGDGARRAECETLAAELDLGGTVTFHGLRPKTEIAELMRNADLYVSASRFENNPVALIEALASGLPAVGTDVGAVADMIGDDGVVVAPGDPDALAAGIASAIEALDDYDRAAIARAAGARYGAETVGRALANVYEAVRSGLEIRC